VSEQSMPNRETIAKQLIDRAMTDDAFRQELLGDPNGVVEREVGISLPPGLQLKVLEEQPDTTYLVLPPREQRGARGLSDEQLETAAGLTGWAKTWDNMCYTDSGYYTCDPNSGCKIRR